MRLDPTPVSQGTVLAGLAPVRCPSEKGSWLLAEGGSHPNGARPHSVTSQAMCLSEAFTLTVGKIGKLTTPLCPEADP